MVFAAGQFDRAPLVVCYPRGAAGPFRLQSVRGRAQGWLIPKGQGEREEGSPGHGSGQMFWLGLFLPASLPFVLLLRRGKLRLTLVLQTDFSLGTSVLLG